MHVFVVQCCFFNVFPYSCLPISPTLRNNESKFEFYCLLTWILLVVIVDILRSRYFCWEPSIDDHTERFQAFVCFALLFLPKFGTLLHTLSLSCYFFHFAPHFGGSLIY